jgi:hypothetical protein
MNRVTVCIALRSHAWETSDTPEETIVKGQLPTAFPVQRIVAICDRMLTYPDYTVDDIAFKKLRFHPNWRAMYSSDNIGPVTPMARFVEEYLRDKQGTYEEVTTAFRLAFHWYVQSLAVDSVLEHYNYTLAKWKEDGLKQFGEKEFARINSIIERLYAGLQFLVYGFEPSGQGHLFTIQEEFVHGDVRLIIDPHDIDGFAIIGSGTTAGLSALVRKALPVSDIDKLIYRICEAKLFAEKAPGVGKGTILSLLECAAPTYQVREQYVNFDWDAFRAAWEKEAQPTMPSTAFTTIQVARRQAITMEKMVERIQQEKQKEQK